MAVERKEVDHAYMPSGILTAFAPPAAIQKQSLGNMQLSARKEVVQDRYLVRIKKNTLQMPFKVCVEPSTWQWTNCLACGETPSRELKFK